VNYQSIFMEGPGKTMTNVRIPAIPSEIRAKHLSNMSQEGYRCASLLGLILLCSSVFWGVRLSPLDTSVTVGLLYQPVK
jgi:hypothetical protein